MKRRGSKRRKKIKRLNSFVVARYIRCHIAASKVGTDGVGGEVKGISRLKGAFYYPRSCRLRYKNVQN